MFQRAQRILWVSIGLGFLVAAGCGAPKPGEACKESDDKPACQDPKTKIACVAGKWELEPCRGGKGCEGGENGAKLTCDHQIAAEGETCLADKQYSCSEDGKSQLRCTDAKWKVADRCLGPNGCSVGGFFAKCDTSIGNEGDVCSPDEKGKGGYSCRADGKAMLFCKDNKWKQIEECLGTSGCSGGLTLRCDGPVAKDGGFCDKGEKDDYACSADGKNQLKCEATGWKTVRPCLGPKGCSSSILGVACDESVVAPGSECTKEEAAACSTDGKTILECKKGKFEKSKVCPAACKVGAAFIECE